MLTQEGAPLVEKNQFVESKILKTYKKNTFYCFMESERQNYSISWSL